MPYLPIITAIAAAAFFYAAGEQEARLGVLWGGVSLILSALVIIVLGGGTVFVFAVQIAYLLAITAYRMWRDPI